MIGLPKDARLRVEAAARQRKVLVSSVFADIGREGTFKLLPHEDQAIYALREYVDSSDQDYDACVVCVIPYAPLPHDLQDELDVLAGLGGLVVRPSPGEDGWPSLSSAKRRDQAFWDALYLAVTAALPGEPLQPKLPSECFDDLAQANPRFLVTEGSLQYADHVAKHRYEFLRRAANALDLYSRDGSSGRIDAFFAHHGLDHAQTGGITTTLKLHRGGVCVLTQSSNTHLKQGDKTSRYSAARVYYQAFTIDGEWYAAVLYAGPHPEDDLTREHHMP